MCHCHDERNSCNTTRRHQIEAIEKLPLVPIEPPHHRSLPPRLASRRPNYCSSKNSNDFCNKIGPSRPSIALLTQANVGV